MISGNLSKTIHINIDTIIPQKSLVLGFQLTISTRCCQIKCCGGLKTIIKCSMYKFASHKPQKHTSIAEAVHLFLAPHIPNSTEQHWRRYTLDKVPPPPLLQEFVQQLEANKLVA